LLFETQIQIKTQNHFDFRNSNTIEIKTLPKAKYNSNQTFSSKYNWNTIEIQLKYNRNSNIKSKIDLIKCDLTFCPQMNKNETFYELLMRL
jgi:hypothetical protein